MSTTLLISILITAIAVSAVFALTGLTGLVSFGQAAYMSIGAYTSTLLYAHFAKTTKLDNIPNILLLLLFCACGIAVAALVAFIMGTPTLKLRRDYFALITVTMGEAVAALVITLKSITGGSTGFSKIPKVPGLLYITIAIAILAILFMRNFKYSRYGRMCIAVKNDELAAKSFAIRVFSLKRKVYVMASIICAVAGILTAFHLRFLEPSNFGWTKSSELVIFMFFGGTNSLTGAIVAALGLGSLPELLRNVTLLGRSLQEYRTIIYCILIILILNFRPSGLFGEWEFQPIKFIKAHFTGKKTERRGKK